MWGDVLPAEFELDHIIPLFEGGADCYITNSQALCPNCHARKTQSESIRRRELRRQHLIEAIESARRVHEQKVWSEEQAKRKEICEESGTRRCELCQMRYYPIFPHTCRKVAERVQERLGVTHPQCNDIEDDMDMETNASNPFLQFAYVSYYARRTPTSVRP